jgi:hypothetical protein
MEYKPNIPIIENNESEKLRELNVGILNFQMMEMKITFWNLLKSTASKINH